MFSPIKTLYMYFPLTFFLRVFFILAIDLVVAVFAYKFYKKSRIDKHKAISIVLLVTYITIVLFFTVLGRRTLDYYRFGTGVISYYTELFSGSTTINITELLLNILMFVPIGVISCFLFKRFKIFCAGAIGLGVSSLIESLQFLLRNGYVSLTDIIHNTLGTFIGGLLAIIIVSIVNNIIRKSKSKVKTDDSN